MPKVEVEGEANTMRILCLETYLLQNICGAKQIGLVFTYNPSGGFPYTFVEFCGKNLLASDF